MAVPIDDPAPAGPPDVSVEEVRAQLARILESDEFRAARNRARFLDFVVGRSLSGGGDTLKEYTIGVEVFDRGTDFDPRADGVVRNQAGLVRKHLELYYEAEGVNDPIEIALPKGRYVARFLRREPGTAPPRPAPVPTRRRLAPSVGTLAIAVAAVVLLLRTAGDRSPASGAAGAELYRPVWGPLLDPDAPTVLAFGVPQFFTSKAGIWVRDVDVNNAAGATDSERLKTIGRDFGPLKPAEAYTGVGEAYGVHVLTRFFVGRGHDLRVVRSPSVTWEDLKRDNVIFLSSARFRTLAKQLSYPVEFEHIFGPTNLVRNVHPAHGEQAEYAVQSNGSEGPDALLVDYAVVSVWPGKTSGRRILVLNGAYTWGTQAAAEYVTEPDFLRDLNERLAACQRQRGLAHHPEYFQILLRVEGRDNQPIATTFVTHHDLALDEATGALVALAEPVGR